MGGLALIGQRIWMAVIVALLVVEEQRTLAFQEIVAPPTKTFVTLSSRHNTRPHQYSCSTRSASNTQCRLFNSSPKQSQEFINSSEVTEKDSSPFDRPLLMALDVASLTAFSAVGKASHAPDGSIDAAAVAVTAAPFVVAWLGTSPWTGVYRSLGVGVVKEQNENNLRQVAVAAMRQTIQGWVWAVPLGCALRGVIKGYVPPVPFVVVTLVATLVILGGTRTLYALAQESMIQKE